MSKFFVNVNHVPSYAITGYANSILRRQIDEQIPQASLEQLFLWDNYYYAVKLSDYHEIFMDVLINLPPYMADRFDCENFAMIATSRVLEKYRLNTCGIVIGDSPMGKHGWNVFWTGEELWYLEPQNGDFMVPNDYGSHGYVAELIIMG